MNFCLVGLSHKTAPVEVRERLAFPEEQLAGALRALVSLPGVREALILSTCNRVELVARTDSEDSDVGSTLAWFLAQFHNQPLPQIESYLYRYQQRDAIRHLFRVAGSLDSMVIGETQILGQVKAAYALAREVGTLRGPLE